MDKLLTESEIHTCFFFPFLLHIDLTFFILLFCFVLLFIHRLAGASVGTVEYRSITESVRESFVKVIHVLLTTFTVPYDNLIVTVGAQTNTSGGIKGVREYCCFLKQVEDVRRIRTAIVNCFERANLPNLDETTK